MSTTTRPDSPANVVLASTAEDAAAVEAVREHHAELAGRLAAHTEHLLRMVAAADSAAFGQARAAAADFCTEQLLPHAAAEEDALYPAAAALPQTKLLVEAMIAEHRVLEGLVRDLGEATEPPRVVAAAHALRVLFDSHLAKENDLILPAAAADPAVSLTGILAGMHELLGEHGGHQLGDHEEGHAGCGCGQAEAHAAGHAAGHAGCGCGHAEAHAAGHAGCGCGEADGPAGCGCNEVDEDMPELDVRTVPHAIRHATVIGAFDAIPAGGSLLLIAPHDPLPLLRQLSRRTGGAMAVSYEQRGPEAWHLRLTRT